MHTYFINLDHKFIVVTIIFQSTVIGIL